MKSTVAAWGFLALLGEVATAGCRLEYQVICVQRGCSLMINYGHYKGMTFILAVTGVIF
jgi:hypothetical protein